MGSSSSIGCRRLRNVAGHLSLLTLLLTLLASLQLAQPISDNWSAQVKALIRSRQLHVAESMIVARMMARPRDAKLITLLAEVRLDQGRFKEALTLLNAAHELAGASAFRAALTGLAETGEGRLDLAELEFRKAIRLDATYAAAHYFLARVLYTQNHFDESIRESERALSLSPRFVRAYENLGLCYEGKQQLEEAKRWYLEAIRLESEGEMRTEWPMLDLATLLIKNNQASEAEKYLSEALAINPHNSHAVYEEGVLLEGSGNLQGALQEFKRAAELAPHHANAYYRIARIYEKLGNEAEAQRNFALFRKVSERDHSPHPETLAATAPAP